MSPNFKIRPQDIPLLIRALQSLEQAPASWFGPVGDPTLVPAMKNAAHGLPAKLQLHTLQLSDIDVLTLQQACAYQCLDCHPSKQDQTLLEGYFDQFSALLAMGNPDMFQ